MRRALKWIGWIVAVLIGLPLALLVAVLCSPIRIPAAA